ncbi:dynein axonemal heavy chain 14 [Ahaetulla prasina]|uniref:dynein axonemal heavy chain 14 n=1 Tax=Ahaetulla prasina TaxID=499056 RepID=UPI0026470791|nr:dynein axonemal heavy chain 14 [Ahaetulla prasina]
MALSKSCEESGPLGDIPGDVGKLGSGAPVEFSLWLSPINDDAILHILRLRDKLSWQTLLPPCEFVKSKDVAKFRKTPLLDDTLKKDDGEYIYCLIRSRDDPKAAYNPYDLQVVSANMARQSKEYWTISASYVSKFTSVCGKQEMEICPVMEWLYERQLYNVLHNMDLYFNFRKKKYFILWKNIVKYSKTKRNQMILYKQLFSADEILQSCLLYLQTLCVDASNPEKSISSEKTTINFIKINTSYTYTLDKFCEEQYQQSQYALSQLKDFKDKVTKVIKTCFLKVAKMKGAETLFQHSLHDFKEKPKYYEIAEWRHVMERFSKFLKLVDRIFQEFLRRLVNNALNTLLEIFKGSSNMTISKRKTNESLMRAYKDTIDKALCLLTENRCQWVYENEHFEGTQKLLRRSKESEAQREIVTVSDIDKILEEVKRELKGEEEYSPIFEINICLRIPYEKEHRRKYYQNDDDYITESSAESLKEILDFDEVLNSSSFEDDRLQEEKSESTTEDLGIFRNEEIIKPLRKEKEAISDSNKQLITYESSLQFSTDVSLIPNRKTFSIQLQGIVDGLENIIDQVTPFSQDSRLSIFIDQSLHKIMQQCEDYTDFEPGHYQSTWPNCDLILGTDPDYQNKILDLLSLQSSSLARVESYSRNFMEYCSMVDKAKYTNDKIVALQREMTTKEFRKILENYTVDVKEIVCMLIEKRISLFRVNSLNFQTDCLPYFEVLLKTIHIHFYTAIDTKNVHLVEVTQSAVAKLNKELVTVDGFVEHLLYLQEISSQLPSIKVEYNYLSELHFIANDYNIFLPHQQLALYQTVVRTLQNLQSTILICEKLKDDYVIKFNESLGEFMDNLQVEMKEYKSKVRNPVLLLSETLPKTAKEMIENLIEEAGIISEKILNYANYQHVLDGAIGDMKSLSVEKLSHRSQAGDSQRVNAELSEIEGELQLRKLLWDSHEDWAKRIFKWKHTIFWNLDVDVIQTEVNRFMQRIHILEKGLPENTILPIMKKSLMDFKESLPIIISLRNPSLQRRHWETIQNIVGESISWDKRLTLEKILELNMFQYRKDINEISIRASKETTLEVMLKKIIGVWQKTDFHLCPYYTETSSICIISSVEDITTLLEESLMTISTIKSSCFVEPIKNLVHAWDHKLNFISCTLEEWLTCQRHWIYLEPIFQAPEIKRQLPGEASLFSVVDNKWKEIMTFAEENPNVAKATTTSGIFEILQSNNASLEKIQKALEEHLEVKRMIFPRFYFLSNAELLEIVAESKSPDVVQPHLMKCFANVRKLYIRPQHQTPPVVLMIRSAEGEILLIPKGVRIRGSVEQWLKNVENTICNMVRKFIEVGITEWNQMEFKEWFFTHPGQVILIVSHIKFSQECEAAMLSSNSKKEMIEDLDDLINILEQLTEIASDILPYHKQSTLEALISLSIHNRDILSLLIDQEIGIKDFEWTRQLRYKWHECNLCTVIQGYASFEYGYEYLGCSPRLVITPLTDQCWLTITGALQLNLGCCLAGPAGTGKTETVKDLSKALGKFCLTYNCSGDLDDKVMGKLFFGLVQSGSWCCFDEFNRIDIEVLSAIASHLQAIKAAKDSLSVRFVLEGKEIRLRPHCAIFITMNPGYKGRVELPDNLKSLFRPMSMVIPDYELIAEIMLFSEGFKSSKLLSGKIVNLYQLSSKRLSQQDHYDFGMRAIKTVLIRVGQRRQELKLQYNKKRFSAMEETLITIDILKEVNLPKLIADDVPVFEDIIRDLFTEMEVPKVNPKRLESAISLAIQHLSLQPWENQIEKVIQLYNQLMARVGVMLVGPTGGGKTTIRTILEKALIIFPLVDTESATKLDVFQSNSKRSKVDTFVVNPKCVTIDELFGQTNPSTMEWSDGLLSSAVRGFAKLGIKKTKRKDPSLGINSEMQDLYTLNTVTIADAVVPDEIVQSTENIQCETAVDWQWIILDGPVDPLWIENLNSVLDDSRTLCLANSERIYLSPAFRVIFEVDSVSQANPATISRCAMVYVDPADLGWEPYVKTWLQSISEIIPENSVEYLESLFHSSIKIGLTFLNKHKKMQAFPVHQLGIVMNICRIIGSFIHVIKLSQGSQDSKKRRQSSTVSFSTVNQRDSPQFLETFSSFSGTVPSIMKKRGGEIWFWEKEPNKMLVLLGKIFIFAFTWAVGGILKREEEHEGETLIDINTSQDELAHVTCDFNYLVRELFDKKPPTNIQMPSGDKTVFDYFVDLQTGEFEPWGHLVPSTQFLIQKETSELSDSDNNMLVNQEKKMEASAFIPNIDTIRHSFLASLLLLSKHPVLIIGDPGSGKTTMIDNMLGRLQKDGLNIRKKTILGEVFYYNQTKITSLMRNYSTLKTDQFRSSWKITHSSTKELHVIVIYGFYYTYFKALLFIDDLNMPITEAYGSKPPLEFIRQFVELGGFYDIKHLEWKIFRCHLEIKLFDYFVDLQTGEFEPWGHLVPSTQFLIQKETSELSDSDNNMLVNQEKKMEASAFIPNIDTIRHSFLASLLLLSKHPVLIIVSALSSIREDSDVEEPSSGPIICKLQLGAHTSAAQTKSLITQKLILKSKDVMGAPQSKQALLFIDDLNMPITEAYGSKPPLEFIRQFVELGGFYDIKHLEWKNIQDIATVACCTPLNVGSNEISTRLLSRFCILVLPATSLQSLQRIFQISWTKEKLMEESPIFVDFLDYTVPVDKRIYRNVTSQKVLLLTLEEYYVRMQTKESEITMVFFKEAIQHVIRAARVFRQQDSHMTLIGLNGNGKATCASLACYISECCICKLSTSYSYTFAHFQEDIKKVYKQAGAEGKRTVLLITDSDIIQESFLEILSCILKSGQVPNLFEKDELNNIIESLTSVSEMIKDSNKLDDMYSFFLQRVRHNLHIVLTVNPTGLVFRQYLQIYPAIVNCCTVDWYENWPEEALCHVAKSYFSQSETFRNENLRDILIPMTVNIHKNASIIIEKYLKKTKRHYYITPKSYLQFINTFSTILRTTKEKMLSERACYNSGLTKILDATSQIANMQNELLVLGPQIESKSKEIEALVAKLHKDALVVEQVRTLVKKDEETMTAETKIVEGYAKQVTEELNTVLPSLEKALSALDALDKNHIAEVRVYTHPPALVLTVMNAVCVLLQKKPNWATAKLLLSDPGFLKKLVTIDKDNLPEKVFLQLKKYVRSPDFNPMKVGLVSVACCSICQWILALDHYHIVKRFVDPKQAKVMEAEELLNRAFNKLAEKQRCLALIEQHQQNLEALYDESIAEQEKLAARKSQTTRRLHSASILSVALKDEMERWNESVNNLDQRLQGIVGDVLISAACIVYSGMLSAEYRQQLVNDSLKLCSDNNILISPNYSLVNCMTEKNEVRRWQNAGLPHDQYSTENAIFVKHGQRWPLLIDPERQAYKWICQMEGSKLRQICATDVNYLRTIEYALQFGDSVLLQDFPETLDSNIKSILSKEIYKKGGQEFIRIADSEIQYNSDFRLYLTTQKPNPHFLPATCNIVTMINFTLTFHGLQNQLLSAVVNKEKPELEEQYCKLMESISIDLVALHEYEQRSLQLLQRTSGHLLDDQDLIENLQRTKITSSEIFQRVADSAATEVTIEGLRKAYIPIATRGAVLYFVISDLIHINHVYQFSLNWFHKIFVDSIDIVKKNDISLSDALSSTKISEYKVQSEETLTESETEIDHFKIHINDIIETLTYHVYETVSSALFNKNKLCFAFLLCTAIMKNNCGENVFTNKLGFISDNEWNFFLYSSMIANIKQPSISDFTGSCIFNKTAPFHWISEMMWKECQYMSTQITAFSLLCSSLSTYPQQWKDFLDSENVYDLISTCYRSLSPKQDAESQLPRESEEDEESIPVIFPWEKLSPFERLILIKVLRSEMLNRAVQIFVTEKLGTRYFQTGGINLKGVYEESDSTTPLILIHTHGIDIIALVLRFAQEIKRNTQNVQMLSLGRGQGSKAEELIYKAQILGEQWVFLQNCHLATSFMPRLCKIVDSFILPDTTINPGFRLWLSSTPDTSLPIPILRRGLKIIIETPQGLKGTLLQTFGFSDTAVVTETIFNKINCGPSWKRLLFSLCFFNAVIQERKKYGVLGWNIPYAFNSSDLEFSIKILEVLLEKHQKIPWTALHYLTGEVTYGGHVTDNWDRRCLLNILDNFYNPSVLQEDFVYTADEVYRPISEVDSLKDCRAYLQSLPEVDSPELFGMHHCAERQYLKVQAELFINSIVSTQPTYSTDIISDRMGQDEIVMEIVSDILIKLPMTVENMEEASTNEYVSTEIVTLRSFMSGPTWAALAKATEDFYSITSSPLLPVLRQEIDHCNNLLYLIIRSLQELQEGIKGKIIFTKRLEELYNSILKGRVADLWEQSSFKTNKPLGSWIDDLIIQVNFFAMWADGIIAFMQERFNDLLVLQRQSKIPPHLGEYPDFHASYQGHPSCFWLPGFFFPHGFLIAVCQNYARLNKVTVDSLTFKHKVLPLTQDEDLSVSRKESILNKAFKEHSQYETGVKIYGLYIDGARWNPNTQALDEPELHRRYYPLPDIQFLPRSITFCPSFCGEEDLLLYECPLYKTPQRTGILSSMGTSSNFVTEVNLPSLVNPSHWIMRGVALLCQLDD